MARKSKRSTADFWLGYVNTLNMVYQIIGIKPFDTNWLFFRFSFEPDCRLHAFESDTTMHDAAVPSSSLNAALTNSGSPSAVYYSQENKPTVSTPLHGKEQNVSTPPSEKGQNVSTPSSGKEQHVSTPSYDKEHNVISFQPESNNKQNTGAKGLPVANRSADIPRHNVVQNLALCLLLVTMTRMA